MPGGEVLMCIWYVGSGLGILAPLAVDRRYYSREIADAQNYRSQP
jgi:hypothetical protein